MPKKSVGVKTINRGREVRRDKDKVPNISVTLLDIDTAIGEHFREEIHPVVVENEQHIPVPILYADAERWKNIQRDGVYRDVKGQVQLPIIIFKRSSVARNDSMAMLNRYVNYVYKTKYSPKNRYDKFSLMLGAKPTTELYNVTMPDYVNVTYECMIQTSYIEHMNSIIEQIQFEAEEYWGENLGYKFKVSIDDFSTTTEVSENVERVVKTEFNMQVTAYLLPENFANEITTKKSFTPKRVVFVDEIDATSSRTPASLSGISGTVRSGFGGVPLIQPPAAPTDFLSLFEYMGLTRTVTATYSTNNNTSGSSVVTLDNYQLAPVPTQLAGIISDTDRYHVYINGISINRNDYTLIDAPANPPETACRIDFSISGLLYEVTSTDEVIVIGKFNGI